MLTVSGRAPVARRSSCAARRELRVGPGKCVLLTGKNGAGKTTLIRAIAGLLDPEEGQVFWRGAPARSPRDEFHAELAYLGHEPPLKGDLSARENLKFSIGIRRAVTTRRNRCRTHAHRRRTRSPIAPCACCRRARGAAWRWQGCCSPNAVLWLLDEPTTNLDADGQQLVRDLIERTAGARRHRRGGRTSLAGACRPERGGSGTGAA